MGNEAVNDMGYHQEYQMNNSYGLEQNGYFCKEEKKENVQPKSPMRGGIQVKNDNVELKGIRNNKKI
jgi:hypothetical protein